MLSLSPADVGRARNRTLGLLLHWLVDEREREPGRPSKLMVWSGGNATGQQNRLRDV